MSGEEAKGTSLLRLPASDYGIWAAGTESVMSGKSRLHDGQKNELVSRSNYRQPQRLSRVLAPQNSNQVQVTKIGC